MEKSTSFYKDLTANPPFLVKVIRGYTKFLNTLSPNLAANYLEKLFFTTRIDRKKVESQYQELLTGHSEFLEILGHKVHVYTEGTPKVLLLYGWESSLNRFRDIIKILRKRDIGFIAFDYPAHGLSPGKRVNTVLASKIAKVILDLHPTVDSIIAHSFGGGVARLLVTESSSIKHVVSVGSPTIYTAVCVPFYTMFNVPQKLQGMFLEKASIRLGRKFTDYDWLQLPIPDDVIWIAIADTDDATIDVSNTTRLEGLPNHIIHITNGLGHRRIMHNEEVIKLIIEFIQEKAFQESLITQQH